jgi:hypothetical protein
VQNIYIISFSGAHWNIEILVLRLSIMCLHFSMGEEEFLKHINVKCHANLMVLFKKISWWVELKEVRARRQACVREERSTLDHILTLRTLFEQEVSIGRCLYPCLLISRKTFDTVPCDKLGARLQRLGVPLHLQHVVKAMYTITYTKVQINWQHTHGEVTRRHVPSLPHYLACTLMNLKHIWTRLRGVLRVYLTQWLPFFFMLAMFFYSLNLEQAYNDFEQTISGLRFF